MGRAQVSRHRRRLRRRPFAAGLVLWPSSMARHGVTTGSPRARRWSAPPRAPAGPAMLTPARARARKKSGNGRPPSNHPQRLRLKRIDPRLVGELEIAEVGPEPQADAGPDRREHYGAPFQEGDADAADEIRRPVDAAKAGKHVFGGAEIIDQKHDAGPVEAKVIAKRWTLPIHFPFVDRLRHEPPLAVTQTRQQSASAFAAKNIAIGPAIALERIFDNAGKTRRGGAEEAAPRGTDVFDSVLEVGRIGIGGREPNRDLRRRQGDVRI